MLCVLPFRRAVAALTMTASPMVSGCSSDEASAPRQLASIVITAPPVDLYEGDVVPLSAVVRDATGHEVSGAPLAWSVSDTTRAALANSTLTLLATGSVTVTATSGALSSSRVIAWRRSPVVALTLGLPPGMILRRGDVTPIGVRVDGMGGRVLTGRHVQLTSDDPAVALVDASGRVRAVSAGNVTVRATAEGVTGVAQLQIVPEDATLPLSKLGEQKIPVRVDTFTVQSGDGPLAYEIWLEGGDLTLTGGAAPRYSVIARFATYRVVFTDGQRSLRLDGTSRDFDFGTVAYDARGDLVMTSERISPIRHSATPVSGGFRMQYRSAGEEQTFDLFYRREPE